MARGSIRRRFLVNSIGSALLALALFAGGSIVWLFIDDVDMLMDDGDTFRGEVLELVVVAMLIALPLALIGAAISAVVSSRRSARPLEDAIRAARETTAHDLHRTLPVPTRDDELRDLVVALNDLFVRLDTGFGALARFAADASHELRTPLAVIATELEVSLRHPRSSAEWEKVARNGLEELQRLSALVEGLLALARAGSDAPAARKRVRLVECVDAVVAQLTESAEKVGVSLSGPAKDSDDRVDGNPVMLETAIRNLAENAVRATPRGGRVELGLEPRGSELVVTVDDEGPGLGADPELLFVPFHRGAPGNGAGLGLAIARRVASAHGGRLDTAKSPLGGARFELGLPRAS